MGIIKANVMSSLGWAIVSTGRHSDQKMAPAINKSQCNHISAVVSRDLNRAKAFAYEHNVSAAYDDFEKMLQDKNVDAVYLASPNHLHADQTIKSAIAGKHVLCEKPMALSVRDGENMIEACENSKVNLAIGFHLRAHPAHQYLRSLVSEGILGTISLAQVSWVRGNRGQIVPPNRPDNQKWWEDPSMVGAGVTMATGVHCVDLLRYILDDEICEISSMFDSEKASLEHIATMLIRFNKGTIASIITSRRNPDWPSQDVSIYGSLGSGISLDSVDTTLKGKLEVQSESVNKNMDFGSNDSISLYVDQIEAFSKSIQGEGLPLATGQDGLQLIKVVNAMIESQRSGSKVFLDK